MEYRQWGAFQSKAVFLLVHGLGAHAGRWEAAGEFFTGKSIASYAVEFKNFNSPDNKTYSFEDLYAGILRLREIAAKENPGRPVFLVGESFGAILSILAVSREADLFKGLVCISPAFANRVMPSGLEQLKIAVSLFYNPNKQFKLPFDSAMCTRDTDYRKKMEEDSREYRTISSRLVLDVLLAQARARDLKDKIRMPVLFLLAGEDKLADPASARKIFNGMAAKDKTLVEFPGMYHSLSIELGKEKVFEEIWKWVEERIKK